MLRKVEQDLKHACVCSPYWWIGTELLFSKLKVPVLSVDLVCKEELNLMLVNLVKVRWV